MPVLLIEKASYHIRSNEVAENVHHRREQSYERGQHRLRAMIIDSTDDIQVNAVGFDEANFLQQGSIGLRTLERSREERRVPVIANRPPEALGHTVQRSLHCFAACQRLRGASLLALEQLPG
jgi:hypothetical protein